MNKIAKILFFPILVCTILPNAIANTVAVNADVPDYLLPVRMDKRPYGFYNSRIEYQGGMINYYVNHDDNLTINFHGRLFTFKLSDLIKEATQEWGNASRVGGKPLLTFNQVKSLKEANMEFNVMHSVINGLNSEITAAVTYMMRLSAHFGRRLTLDDLHISPQEAEALKLAITKQGRLDHPVN